MRGYVISRHMALWRVTLTRSIFRLGLALILPCFLLLTLVIAASSFALAQGSGVSQITGIVLDVQGRPIGDARVRLSGPVSQTISTSGDGSFVFLNLPVGTYRLDISKGGFSPGTQTDIVTTAGSTTKLSFALPPASLTIIGNVSVSTHGANTINTTPASIVDVPASTFTQQGQLSVNQVLNEEPGITMGSVCSWWASL